MIVKRTWFPLTVALLLTIIATPSFAQSSEERESAARPDRSGSGGNVIETQKKAIAGSWQQVITMINPPPGVPAEFRTLETFTEDGSVLSTSNTNPSLGATAQGQWRHEAGRQFSQTCFSYLFDPIGNHTVTMKIRCQKTLNESGDEFTALYKIDFLTPDGNLIFSGEATGIGKRFTVVPF